MTNTRPILRRKPVRKLIPETTAGEPPANTLPTVTGPLIERVPVPHGQPRIVVTPDGLTMLEALAADGAPQSVGASTLGISISSFKKMLSTDEDGINAPVMLAWQRGTSRLEHEVSRHLLNALRKGHVVAGIYFSKARLGWTETPPPGDARTNIVINLPDAHTPESYMKIVNGLDSDKTGKRQLVRKVTTDNDGGTIP